MRCQERKPCSTWPEKIFWESSWWKWKVCEGGRQNCENCAGAASKVSSRSQSGTFWGRADFPIRSFMWHIFAKSKARVFWKSRVTIFSSSSATIFGSRMTVITELLSSPRLQSSLRKIDTEVKTMFLDTRMMNSYKYKIQMLTVCARSTLRWKSNSYSMMMKKI